MEPQLYMWRGARQVLLERHDFYVTQVKRRVIAQFSDIEGEAERFGEAEYERLGDMPGDEYGDMAVIAEMAAERAHSLYGLLSDLKEQMFLGAVAGMYHQWDKDLRHFIERELRHNYEKGSVEKIVWDASVGSVFKVLREFGWDVTSSNFFTLIDACRLTVNVYKHGNGQSLRDLAKRYPQYLNIPSIGGERMGDFLKHEWLSVSAAQFDDIANGLRAFWVAFPERLFLAKKERD
jgi:hypothetical protein